MKTNKQGLSYKPGQITRLDGQRFGALLVLERSGSIGYYAAWKCRCDCGTEVVVGGNKLRNNVKKTCALNGHKWHRDPPATRGGLTVEFPSEYQSWAGMRQRCSNPKLKNYPLYGGRGITIDPRWSEFKNFMLDMGRKPHPKFTIERMNVDGNYEPSNCRWASRAEQNRNKRNSVYVTYQGKRTLLIDLVEELGLSRAVVSNRLKYGFTLAQAISLPIIKGYHPKRAEWRKKTCKMRETKI